jgi:hypothetical protein
LIKYKKAKRRVALFDARADGDHCTAMADAPPHFLTEEWATSYRRKAATPEGASLCARRDYWREGAVIFPAEKRSSVLITEMLENRARLAKQRDKFWAWDYKTSSYTEAELRNIVAALQKIEKKAAREHEASAHDR